MPHEQEIEILITPHEVIRGTIGFPDETAKAVIIFAHGSGSGRLSPRNVYVAQTLQQLGFATLLIDLLTADEERVDLVTRHLRFDINLLASRLSEAAMWTGRTPATRDLVIGYFGASTGAAAALMAAADQPERCYAVVSRGGRPDLAGRALGRVVAPVLLVVGGLDEDVLQLNRQALASLRHARAKELTVVPGATHLFEEPGALAHVAELAADWFDQHLPQQGGRQPIARRPGSIMGHDRPNSSV